MHECGHRDDTSPDEKEEETREQEKGRDRQASPLPAEYDGNRKGVVRKHHEISDSAAEMKKLHDVAVSKNKLPIVVLIQRNVKSRNCGHCSGCKPCGKCTNCLKNAAINREKERKLAELKTKDPSFNPKGKKIPGIGCKKKLRCLNAVCKRNNRGSGESFKRTKAMIDSTMAEQQQAVARLAQPEGHYASSAGREADLKLFAELGKKIQELNTSLISTRQGCLGKGYSFAWRLIKKNYKTFESFATELAKRGDTDGGTRRRNRDLVVKIIIMIAETNKQHLIGFTSNEEWENAIRATQAFLTGGDVGLINQDLARVVSHARKMGGIGLDDEKKERRDEEMTMKDGSDDDADGDDDDDGQEESGEEEDDDDKMDEKMDVVTK